jgi:hypothetical protein
LPPSPLYFHSPLYFLFSLASRLSRRTARLAMADPVPNPNFHGFPLASWTLGGEKQVMAHLDSLQLEPQQEGQLALYMIEGYAVSIGRETRNRFVEGTHTRASLIRAVCTRPREVFNKQVSRGARAAGGGVLFFCCLPACQSASQPAGRGPRGVVFFAASLPACQSASQPASRRAAGRGVLFFFAASQPAIERRFDLFFAAAARVLACPRPRPRPRACYRLLVQAQLWRVELGLLDSVSYNLARNSSFVMPSVLIPLARRYSGLESRLAESEQRAAAAAAAAAAAERAAAEQAAAEQAAAERAAEQAAAEQAAAERAAAEQAAAEQAAAEQAAAERAAAERAAAEQAAAEQAAAEPASKRVRTRWPEPGSRRRVTRSQAQGHA